jgi:hypothetical protein
VQYKKVASLMIISLAIEHTDLMSNVEQGMSNYEVLFLFGNTYAYYKNQDQLIIFINDLKNLYQMAEFLPSTFIIPCSTFDIQKSYPFNVLYLITFLYCTLCYLIFKIVDVPYIIPPFCFTGASGEQGITHEELMKKLKEKIR